MPQVVENALPVVLVPLGRTNIALDSFCLTLRGINHIADPRAGCLGYFAPMSLHLMNYDEL